MNPTPHDWGPPGKTYTEEEIIEYCNKNYGANHPITITTIYGPPEIKPVVKVPKPKAKKIKKKKVPKVKKILTEEEIAAKVEARKLYQKKWREENRVIKIRVRLTPEEKSRRRAAAYLIWKVEYPEKYRLKVNSDNARQKQMRRELKLTRKNK